MIAAPICLAALIQNSRGWIADVAVICLAVVRLHAHMVWIDGPRDELAPYLQRFTDQNVLSIFVDHLHLRNLHLRPIFAYLRLPLAQLRSRAATIARKILIRLRGGHIKALSIFLHHPLRVEDRG